MSLEHSENLQTLFDYIRKRPAMWFSNQVPAVVTFLEGFKVAWLTANPSISFDSLFKEVTLSRGWEYSAQPVWRQMQERGFEDDAITAEMLEIHYAVWKKAALQEQQPDE